MAEVKYEVRLRKNDEVVAVFNDVNDAECKAFSLEGTAYVQQVRGEKEPICYDVYAEHENTWIGRHEQFGAAMNQAVNEECIYGYTYIVPVYEEDDEE